MSTGRRGRAPSNSSVRAKVERIFTKIGLDAPAAKVKQMLKARKVDVTKASVAVTIAQTRRAMLEAKGIKVKRAAGRPSEKSLARLAARVTKVVDVQPLAA